MGVEQTDRKGSCKVVFEELPSRGKAEGNSDGVAGVIRPAGRFEGEPMNATAANVSLETIQWLPFVVQGLRSTSASDWLLKLIDNLEVM